MNSLSPHLFPKHPFRAGFGTWSLKLRASTGCRGVTGPVPQPLAMSSLISTNADILIHRVRRCQTIFLSLNSAGEVS